MQDKTPISKLGEFKLIEHLTHDFPQKNASTIQGVGDDCAVIDSPEQTLVTTDMLLEGIHFNLEYCPLKYLGYKAAVVNFSDIYAMNGKPAQITVSIGVSSRFNVEDLEELYQGLRWACEEHGVDLVGGDTVASLNGLVISITCIGSAPKDKIVYRSGAKPTDLICVSGNLGAAYMGLQLLQRELEVVHSVPNQSQFDQSQFEGREYLLQRQLKAQARKDIVEQLAKANILPTAMIDISDGLSSELFHICKQSKVGCTVYEGKLPIDEQTARLAEEMNLNVVMCALNGGEDYELLFTCNINDYEKLLPLDDVYIIGHIDKESEGINLASHDGETIPLQAQGWKNV